MSTHPETLAPSVTEQNGWDRYFANHAARFDAALAAVPSMRTRQVHQTGDFTLTVVAVSYGIGADEAAVIAGTADAVGVTLTEDGRSCQSHVWHTGDPGSAEDWVAYERWTTTGRAAHGFIHPVSRQLVQAG